MLRTVGGAGGGGGMYIAQLRSRRVSGTAGPVKLTQGRTSSSPSAVPTQNCDIAIGSSSSRKPVTSTDSELSVDVTDGPNVSEPAPGGRCAT